MNLFGGQPSPAESGESAMSSADSASCQLPQSLYALLVEKEQEFMRHYREAVRLQKVLEARYERLAEREYLLREEFESIKGDLAWRIALMIRRSRWSIAPSGSLRDRILHYLKLIVKVWRREGLAGLLMHDRRKRLMLSQSLDSSPQCSQNVPAVEPAKEAQANGRPNKPVMARLTTNKDRLLEEILAFAPRRNHCCGLPIDVVVPVYKGLDETLHCLRSVLDSWPAAAYELIVINDASPDPMLSSCLREIAHRGLITLLENPVNLGFVKTANRGLALHPDRDVVLLNSDTEVSRDWLDRLHKAAYSAEDIASVTPLSNNATICSYPHFCEDNALPEDRTPAQMDELCAACNGGSYIEVPTGVGFCMYFRRDCLQKVGLLNEEHFGKGYGEENDFCIRALHHGWRHLLATDTFVYHSGGASFGASKNPAIERSMKVLEKLHPGYQALIAGHIAANPALPYRRRLDLARLGGARPTVLYILHNLGGGTEKHVFDLVHRLEQEGRRTLVLRPFNTGRVSLTCPSVKDTPNLIFAVPQERWTLLATLQELGVDHLHIHHTIDVPREVLRLIRDLGVPYDWTIHDYYTICPRINLIDGSDMYCGEPDTASCQSCVDNHRGARGEKADILRWRAEYGAWLAGARKVFVPHHDVAVRMRRYFPEVEFIERRHFETHRHARRVAAPLNPGEPLRVAVIGAVGVHKGSEILIACARDALARNLPIVFHLVGHANGDELHELPNVVMTGRYKEEEIFDILEKLRCHCAFFPSVWPETYTYTLSIAFLGGLFPIAFDLGAPAARIRECGFGHVIPLSRDGAAINDELLAQTHRLAEIRPDWSWTPTDYRNLLGEYYGLSSDSGSCRHVA
jgi:GT2 family glycosyltransferase/glycosyltransferase involved in cell wall biosynthesis